ncbi:MAG: hypothetical protein U0836_00635 [Pirellulales bacterium]
MSPMLPPVVLSLRRRHISLLSAALVVATVSLMPFAFFWQELAAEQGPTPWPYLGGLAVCVTLVAGGVVCAVIVAAQLGTRVSLDTAGLHYSSVWNTRDVPWSEMTSWDTVIQHEGEHAEIEVRAAGRTFRAEVPRQTLGTSLVCLKAYCEQYLVPQGAKWKVYVGGHNCLLPSCLFTSAPVPLWSPLEFPFEAVDEANQPTITLRSCIRAPYFVLAVLFAAGAAFCWVHAADHDVFGKGALALGGAAAFFLYCGVIVAGMSITVNAEGIHLCGRGSGSSVRSLLWPDVREWAVELREENAPRLVFNPHSVTELLAAFNDPASIDLIMSDARYYGRKEFAQMLAVCHYYAADRMRSLPITVK